MTRKKSSPSVVAALRMLAAEGPLTVGECVAMGGTKNALYIAAETGVARPNGDVRIKHGVESRVYEITPLGEEVLETWGDRQTAPVQAPPGQIKDAVTRRTALEVAWHSVVRTG